MKADDIDFEAISTKVEMVKVGLRHTKDGFIASFALNPADTPEDILKDPVGQRYAVVLVRLNGQDEPVASPMKEEGDRAVRLAGTLCGDLRFQEWLTIEGLANDMSETAASVWLRKRLGVTSRKELHHDARARQRLQDVRAEFIEWARHNP